MNNPTDIPSLTGVNTKLGTLERRRNYLDAKLRGGGAYAQSKSSEFDRAEIDAIDAAISALRFCQATRNPNTDLAAFLKWFVNEVEVFTDGDGSEDEFDLAMERAKATLAECGA